MKRTIYSLVVFGVLFLATTLASRPAGAFEATAGYKYLVGVYRSVNDEGVDTNSMGHGAQIDFMWSLPFQNEERRFPAHSLGFSIATGKLTEEISGENASSYDDKTSIERFYRFSFLYEFIFNNGLGMSLGLGGGSLGGKVDYGFLGFTDLGLKYHLKNGFVFSLTTDFMFDPATFSNIAQSSSPTPTSTDDGVTFMEREYSAFVFGLAMGIGYRF